MINKEIIKKIEDFVYLKPRSIQEIAQHVKKNWRTVDRYVYEIKEEYGTIDVRIFREGTRGALKIVYWASIEKVSNSVFQEQLEMQIMNERKKEDFSAFDIFQYVNKKKKESWMEEGKNEVSLKKLDKFKDILLKAKKQILFFSGNLSFINYQDKEIDIFSVLEDVIKKGVKIKIICRVDLSAKENIEKVLSLNFKYGKELIEVRHKEQPLRVTIIDDEFFNLKEIKEPTGRIKELNKKIFIFYTIKDKEWTKWISRIFWKMFSSAISAEKRIEELNLIKEPKNNKNK
jgi:flagellar motor protein MotB